MIGIVAVVVVVVAVVVVAAVVAKKLSAAEYTAAYTLDLRVVQVALAVAADGNYF